MNEQNDKVASVAERVESLDVRKLCKRCWWVFLVGGIALVLFGVLALINPAVALLVLSIYFAASVMVHGLVSTAGALQHRDHEGWWVILLMGLLGVGVGLYALLNPPVSMAAFVYLVAFMAIFLGVSLGMLGYRIRQQTDREWMLYLTAALSLLWGLFIVLQPAAGALSVVYTIATWALVIGVLKILFALKARKLTDTVVESVAELRQGAG